MHAVAHRNSVLVLRVVFLDVVLRRLGLALGGKMAAYRQRDENQDGQFASHISSLVRKRTNRQAIFRGRGESSCIPSMRVTIDVSQGSAVPPVFTRSL